ncbi:MAG TPA: N-acetyl-gamma-glutamyl-phosphate reductase [Gammaproteobacteria bacterium]|nr:N-acetyl-gamma-glutamyl-phosphate reductase [Gammaproteobacteria bacterium]
MINVGIVGGTGYTGVELLRLLALHPKVHLSVVTARTEAGTRIAAMFPNLRGYVDLEFSLFDTEKLARCDLVFFATPNGTAMTRVPSLLEAGVRIIDLSADFRLKDISSWERWYGMPHACPELVQETVYGLPEVNRKLIQGARLVANPGCYPTAVLLGFLPLVESRLIKLDQLIADTKSGVSGAGRRAVVNSLFSEAGDNLKAYAVAGHRHWPEIVQALSTEAGDRVDLVFVPHLIPMVRGIHATLYGALVRTDIDLQEVYTARYLNEPCIDVMPPGAHPETRSVRGANTCRLAVHRPGGANQIVVLSVIDNLVKGAAGQAIQNMNIMFGLEETMGLGQIGLLP